MFKKIANRILLGYLIPLLAIGTLCYIVWDTTKKAFQLEEKVTLIEKEIQESDALIYDIARMAELSRAYVIYPRTQTYRNAYNDIYKKFQKSAKALTEDLQDSDIETLARDLVSEGEKVHKLTESIFKAVNEDRIELAIQRMRSLDISASDRVHVELTGKLEEELKETLEAFERAEKGLLAVTLFGAVLSLLAVIGAGLVVVVPLRQQLTALIEQAQKSGIQVSTSTTQIAAAGRQLEATVTEQVASINEVQATSQQIAVTAGDLAKTIEEVTDSAGVTAEAASNSQVSLGQMQVAMQQLVQATETISAKLGVMNEKANNINNVVTTITKVADQTNLLSLNAAIEAEKAGEYGAGFAVVAREIRRLADQTAVATLEIEQMVKEMQSSVSVGVMEMDKFNKEVGHYVEEVGSIGSQIAQAIQEVQGLTPSFEAVSQRMDEQYQGAEQISTAIAQLNEASHQTVESLQDTNSALTQLDDAAQGLQQEISNFKGLV